jgi:phosphoenolpyruvate-protein phosphotransferase
MTTASASTTLHGIAAAPGLALGPAFRLRQQQFSVSRRVGASPTEELARLSVARETARSEIEALQAHAVATISEAEGAIFEAHLAFLDDPGLLEGVEAVVQSEGCNVEFALAQVLDEYSAILAADDDPVFQARAADLQDIKQRLVRILQGESNTSMALPGVPSIILADDLLPSQTVQLDRSLTLALCTAVGGATSHVAILARGIGLPAVAGLGEGLLDIADGTPLAVDGTQGLVQIHPSMEQQQQFALQIASAQAEQQQALSSAHLPAITSDGTRLAVLANVSSVAEATEAQRVGAEGVGLLRTELLFIDRTTPPSEDEQLAIYRAIADALERQPIIIRTLDIGADKPVAYIDQASEANPALGLRGIRLAATHPDLLRGQLRAIWRIGPGYQIKAMFPMVTSLEEIGQLRAMVEAARAEVVAAGLPILEKLELGIMVEVPSIALLADQAAQLVDFMSIGTNDLTQYSLAVDRTNAAVSALGDAFHPAVLQLIAMTARAGRAHGCPVGICGELGGDMLATELLLGLGITSLSMAPAAIPRIKAALRSMEHSAAEAYAQQVLAAPTTAEVRARLQGIRG